MLIIEHLSKIYAGGVVALNDVSFAVEPHSFTAILGPSGSGKSTLLRCIPQILRPNQGRVLFNGCDLTACSPRELRDCRTQIAIVAQQFNLVRRRTALENCLAGRLQELPLWRCWLSKFPRSLLHEGMSALARVQLLQVAFVRSDRLSGGQQQRVAIARALTQRARLILADEPVASLDPESANTVLNLLRSLCLKEGLTVLCNLHQVELARQYSDRILGLSGGELVLDVPTNNFSASDVERIYKSSNYFSASTYFA